MKQRKQEQECWSKVLQIPDQRFNIQYATSGAQTAEKHRNRNNHKRDEIQYHSEAGRERCQQVEHMHVFSFG
jgi:hypothetical protein